MDHSTQKKTQEEESLNDGYKIGDIYWLNDHPYNVSAVYEGRWFIKDELTEPSYSYQIPDNHTMYYISHPSLNIGSTFLKLSVCQGQPQERT